MGQGWLDCMMEDNANLIAKDVREFTEKGIIDADGVEREYDAIICATGFDTELNSSGTPFIGRNGVRLQDVWDPDPIAYFGVNTVDMPNLFFMFGPNSSPFAGSIVHTFEATTKYIIKVVQKLQAEYLKSIVVKPKALENWLKHVDRHLAKTVMTDNCVTWFKRNRPEGRSIISYPGSALAGYYGWRSPRFEDYDYTSWLPEDDTMAWLGNGNVVAEYTEVGDTTTYMDFNDLSKVLVIPTKDYQPEEKYLEPVNPISGVTPEQAHALNDKSTTPVPNTALDANAPDSTKIAASGESVAPLGSPVTESEPSKPKFKKFY